MGYFSDLDIRMREAGLTPSRVEEGLGGCPHSGHPLVVLDLTGPWVECCCSNVECDGSALTFLRRAKADRGCSRGRRW